MNLRINGAIRRTSPTGQEHISGHTVNVTTFLIILDECFNGIEQIIEARRFPPILSMLEKIREYLMERIMKQKKKKKGYAEIQWQSIYVQ